MFPKSKFVCLPACGILVLIITNQGVAVQAAPLPGPPEQQTAPTPVLVNADALLTSMERSRIHVRDLLAKARARRDTIATPCISDKLTRIDVAIRAARDHRDVLTVGTGGDVEAMGRNLDRINLLQTRAAQLAKDATRCIGSSTEFTVLAGDPVEDDTASSDDALMGGSVGISVKVGKFVDADVSFWWQQDPPTPASPTK